MSRKVLIVTGSRAEYGLLRPIMKAVHAADGLELMIAATGMHLSPQFGNTYLDIEADGFVIDAKVEMLLSSDTPVAIAKSMGIGLVGFADALHRLQPDIMLVLGDRFELLSAVVAALVANIPVAHVHGGETTEGAFDEAIRHSITKMSHLHFVAAEAYARRVRQLGENPDHVFVVGGLGVDVIRNMDLLDRDQLGESLGFSFGARNLLVTFHPVTLEAGTAAAQMTELLEALGTLDDTRLIFTMPNADTEGLALFPLIEDFVERHPRARAYVSLGSRRYLSCVNVVDAVIGNSSSGLTEVPTFRKGTINIGDRQKGRLKAASVIDCAPDRTSIASALAQLYSPHFQSNLAHVCNPYGEGGASGKIAKALATVSLDGLLKKSFYDVGPR